MKKHLPLVIFLFSLLSYSQNSQNLWRQVPNTLAAKSAKATSTKTYSLDLISLKKALTKAPTNSNKLNSSTIILAFPNEQGAFKDYKITATAVLSPELQAKYPSIKSYMGVAMDQSGAVIRFSVSPYGFRATTTSIAKPQSNIRKQGANYTISTENTNESIENKCANKTLPKKINTISFSQQKINIQSSINETGLKLFRIALISNGAFSTSILTKMDIPITATENTKKTAILSYLVSLINDANTIFERDIAISFQLVSNNDALIFLDPTTDNLDDGVSFQILDQARLICDAIIGTSNYDLGHVLALETQIDASGVAIAGDYCTGSNRSMGATQGYMGETMFETFVHEIGHQFNAGHTYNKILNMPIDPIAGVELGYGRTIMSYGRDASLFFHTVSVFQIHDFIQNNTSCITEISTGNSKPNASAGIDVTIPSSTAFILTGTGSDIDTSNLTYNWDQLDAEPTETNPISTATGGPICNWLLPQTTSIRYLPNIYTALNGFTTNKTTAVPAVSRTLNFGFTVRDNDPRGGLTATDKKIITVDGNSGPFKLTSQNTAETWVTNSNQTINWDVANTDVAPVSTPTVDILFSIDGGITYPITLGSEVPNIGTFTFTIPNTILTEKGRLMIKGHNNIFYDVNDTDIHIRESYTLNFEEKNNTICVNNNSSTSFSFTYNAHNTFNETIGFTGSNLQGATFNFTPSTVSETGTTVSVTINNINTTHIGTNELNITGTADSGLTISENINLHVFDDKLTEVLLTSPQNNSLSVAEPYLFNWELLSNVNSYIFEISLSESFDNIHEQVTISTNSYSTSSLAYSTSYYWRVKPLNPCSEGAYSTVFSFTTIAEANSKTIIPDVNFEQALIDLGYDSELDGSVLTSTIKNIETLDISNKDIVDLTGIENFISLISLVASSNKITTINLQFNMALVGLHLNSNKLSNIDLSVNTHLANLDLSSNELSTINLTKNTELLDLYIFNNQLQVLDLSFCPKLTLVECQQNQLSHIDTSNALNLIRLRCQTNNLRQIDVSKNVQLQLLNVSENLLQHINTSQNVALTGLWAYDNLLNDLDLSQNKKLQSLSCPQNNLSEINLTINHELKFIALSKNNLSTIDVTNNLKLERLTFDKNSLTSINLDNNVLLGLLSCQDNYLSSLNVSLLASLYWLQCDSNLLTEIDISSNLELIGLNITNNQLTSIDFTNNQQLSSLFIRNNKIKTLDTSSNKKLIKLGAENNNLEFLNIKNGNDSDIKTLYIVGNPNLTCVQVNFPEKTSQYLDWHKDLTTSFSVECSYDLLDIDKDGVFYNDDLCHGTLLNTTVDQNGCNISQLDNDNDGVKNSSDACNNTPIGESVNTSGCAESELDDDNDGIMNNEDFCLNTPIVEPVNTSGCSESQLDDDNDGIMNNMDSCPNTPNFAFVNPNGCSQSQIDDDNDGVMNNADGCSNTPNGETVDEYGCSKSQLDYDEDGIMDNLDLCPNTPTGQTVNENGCSLNQLDADGDGVLDDIDICPNTPNGETTYENGCSDSQLDDDNDGVSNDIDLCTITPEGATVDENGCAESELDDDFDGVPNPNDSCPYTPIGEVSNSSGCSESQLDDDNDNVMNNIDTCPNTPTGESVNDSGCSASQLDDDNDNVMNSIDTCPNTPTGESVNETGCSESQLDDDNDNVMNNADTCPNTPNGETVNENGCSESQLDDDNDNVMNNVDTCPNTPNGESVNDSGCSESQLDDDSDGVANASDLYPNTPTGAVVDGNGGIILIGNTFSLSQTGLTCPNENNGSITLTNASSYLFDVQLTSPNNTTSTLNNVLTANGSHTLSNLPPGEYRFTMVFDGNLGMDIGQYIIHVADATEISAKVSETNKEAKTATVKVQNATVYHIKLNGNHLKTVTFKTTDSHEIVIPLQEGENHINISSDTACKGSVDKWITIAGTVAFYPNPTVGTVFVRGLKPGTIHIKIVTLNGQIIKKITKQSVDGTLEFSVAHLPEGVYIVHLSGPENKIISPFKIVKK